MKALLDYHHADLAESLHLLLEDRLGIECWIPVGHGWWDRSYWAFGRSTFGDDRLAQQFLTSANVEVDDAHPGRHHRVVTVEEALEQRWDYVVASVPDNYRGYHDFAQRSGARFVIQVGNVNQPIAWELGPLVLNSSEAPLSGRGVTYHQEFSLADFAPDALPGDDPRIASFVNCMDRMPCWPHLRAAQTALGDFTWRIHGIDGADGNLKPTAAVGEAMRQAGWAWHDKVTGDGFGHVIHNWAAVGRPLIGHAGHYAGQMAGPLWEDGRTCIDLGRHSMEETARLVREISADRERHEQMCADLRTRFAELVDYDAEAERIGALLA